MNEKLKRFVRKYKPELIGYGISAVAVTLLVVNVRRASKFLDLEMADYSRIIESTDGTAYIVMDTWVYKKLLKGEAKTVFKTLGDTFFKLIETDDPEI